MSRVWTSFSCRFPGSATAATSGLVYFTGWNLKQSKNHPKCLVSSRELHHMSSITFEASFKASRMVKKTHDSAPICSALTAAPWKKPVKPFVSKIDCPVRRKASMIFSPKPCQADFLKWQRTGVAQKKVFCLGVLIAAFREHVSFYQHIVFWYRPMPK